MDLKTVYFAVETLNDYEFCLVDGLDIVIKTLGVLPLRYEPFDIQWQIYVPTTCNIQKLLVLSAQFIYIMCSH
jgi:hypothetical protein